MCGRFTLKKPPASVEESPLDNAIQSVAEWKARFNIAPTQKAVVVRKKPTDDEALELASMRWGLIPNWAKSVESSPLINARAETIGEKPSFKAAYQRRRCLVPADGFFEWKRQHRINQPHYFQIDGGKTFFMAGLWESWQQPEGTALESFTIITTQANALMRKYHDRMPVILDHEKQLQWLGHLESPLAPNLESEIFTSFPAKRMSTYPVSQHVNNVLHNDPSCIEENSTGETTQLDLGF